MSDKVDSSTIGLSVRTPASNPSCDGPGHSQEPIQGLNISVLDLADKSDPLHQFFCISVNIGERLGVKISVAREGSAREMIEIAVSGLLRFAIREHALIRDLLAEENR